MLIVDTGAIRGLAFIITTNVGVTSKEKTVEKLASHLLTSKDEFSVTA